MADNDEITTPEECRRLAGRLKRLRSEAWAAGDVLRDAAEEIERLEEELEETRKPLVCFSCQAEFEKGEE